MSKSSDIRDYSVGIIIKLIDLNKGVDAYTKCNGIMCMSIKCSTCPMKGARSGEGAVNTLGELRKADHSKKPVEQEECAVKEPEAIEGVREPSHYTLFDGIEAIEIIARSMTTEQFRGYILGTVLKYRLRAGKKQDLAYAEKDLAKASFFTELYEKHKGLCYDAK